MSDIATLENLVKEQGDVVRKLKGDKAPKDQITAAVNELLARKEKLKAAGGAVAEAKPAKEKKGKGSDKKGKSAPPPSDSGNKKEKKASKEERMAAKALGDRAAPVIPDINAGDFGDLETVRSQYKTNRTFAAMSQLSAAMDGQFVWIRGRVHNVRKMGSKSAFIVLRRGMNTVQTLAFENAEAKVSRDLVKYASKIPLESVVDMYAQVKKSPEPIQSCSQTDIELLIHRIYGVSISEPLPFQVVDAMNKELAEDEEKKEDGIIRVGQDVRLNSRWIDLRTPTNHAIFKIQSGVGRAFREFLYKLDFTEIHTPKMTPGVSEGGAEVFRIDYFGSPGCMAQSPQLYKQMASAAGDLYRVFEIGPVFRAEKSFTHRHLCEFVGLDFEMEIVEHYHEVLKVLGDLMVSVFDWLNTNCKAHIEKVNEQYPFEPLVYPKDTIVIPFNMAHEMLVNAGVDRQPTDDLDTASEKLMGKLMKKKFNTDFYIIDKYPLSCRPFYTMPDPDNPGYTNSYDVFIRGEEITSGAQRIHDVKLLMQRAEECGIPADNITSYVNSFRSGAPPHGGAGIGLERVVMLFLGLNNIRKSSMFPRDPTRLNP